MLFRTEVFPKPYAHKIHLKDPVFLIGSCFSEHVGQKFQQNKFQTCINPYGILFHPVAMARAIREITEQKVYTQQNLLQHEEIWCSLHHHSSFSSPDANACLLKINERQKKSNTFLKQAKYAFITLGTSWVYEYLKSNEIVANCHKIEANQFKKRCLSEEEITQSLVSIIHDLISLNKEIQIVLTISPVRHWKDGVEENQYSKALLCVAIHKLVQKFPNNTYYFPAYELVMDDLRDYRFYEKDLLHPNQLAIDYVWEKLVDACMEDKTKEWMTEIEKINRNKEHKPFYENAKNHQAFLEKTQLQINQLEKQVGIKLF